MRFAKPSLSIADQLALLERRGMVVPDAERAQHFLRHVSYYRLRAYWLPFEVATEEQGEHLFRDAVSFDDALSLYVFDRQLRLLVMDAIERIEVSLRGGWAHYLAVTYGPHGYLDAAIYHRTDHFAKALTALIEEFDRSKDTFVAHYRRKYTDPLHPPIWMTAEVLSLGQLSKWFSNLKLRADRQAISRPYGVDERVMVSIAHHLTYVRNICAHHGRLWNKQFTVTMTVPNSPVALKLAMNGSEDRRLYNTLVAIGYLIDIVAPGTEWRDRVVELVTGCDRADTTAMGFPGDWKGRPFWTSTGRAG